jgi:CHAT domain-containing protein
MKLTSLHLIVFAVLAPFIPAQDPPPADMASIPTDVRPRYVALNRHLQGLSPDGTLPRPGNLPAITLEEVGGQVIAMSEQLRSKAPRSALRLLEDWYVCVANNGYGPEDVLPWVVRIRDMSVESCGCHRLRYINQVRRRLLMGLGRQQPAIAAVKDTVERCLEAKTVERPYLRIWLHIDLARELLFEVHRPLEAARYIDSAVRDADALPAPWPEEVASRLKKNFNIWITDRVRPGAATFEDTKGQALLIRGMIRARLGAGQDGIRDYAQAAELFAVSGNRHRRNNCRHNLAGALYQLGRLQEARALAKKVRQDYVDFVFADGRRDTGGAAQMDKILAHIARSEGRWKEACELYDACFKGFAGMTRAEFLEKPEHQHYHSMESLMYGAECRVRLGELAAARQDLSFAADFYSFEGNKLREADAQRIRALLALESGKLSAALAAIEAAQATFQRYGQLPLSTQCALTKGHILKRKGDYGGAIASFAESADYLLKGMNDQTISQSEDASHAYRTQYRPAMDGILECLIELRNPTDEELDAAYRAVQVFHGFGLVGALTGGGAGDWMQQLPSAEKEKYLLAVEERRMAFDTWLEASSKHCQSLAGMLRKDQETKRLETRLRAIESSIRSLETAAYSRWSERNELVSPEPSNLTDVETTTGKNTVLLEFVAGEKLLHAFVFRGGESHYEPIAGLEKIHESVTKLHGARETRAMDGALTQLSRLILEPLAPHLAGVGANGVLLVSPAGDLCAVPFAALTMPGGAKRLVETWNLAYVHSGTVYRELVGQRQSRALVAKHRFVGFGNPDYKTAGTGTDSWRGSVDVRGLKPLPGTEKELESIASIVKKRGGDATLFLGKAATERELHESDLVPKATILHFACHGIANRRVPSLSLLALSPEGDGDSDATDGLLLRRELRDLRLRPSLLTLSACETNVGELADFEGTLGLTRAAIASGAEAVLSTLWRIPDDASTQLVIDFYKKWVEDGLERPRALAEAQRAALRRGAPTTSWAAFTLWDIDR